MKKCKYCEKNEGEVQFYLRYKSVCKKCHNEYMKDYRRKKNIKDGYSWY
mgnify:CR=1 FL=1